MPESSRKVKSVLGIYKQPTLEELKQRLKKVAETTPTDYDGKRDFYDNKYRRRFGGKKTKTKKSKSKRKRATKKQRK